MSGLGQVTKRLLVGRPYASDRATEQLLPKRIALPVFASDPLSSVAYATEEILLVLSLGGIALLRLSVPVAAGVVVLLAVVVASYRQTVYEYPRGGGAYQGGRGEPGSAVRAGGRARALAYARATRPDRLTALTVEIDDADTQALREDWDRRRVPVPLTVIESPYREITRPVPHYVKDLRRSGPRDVAAVFIPEYVVGRWWEQPLHNQSALRLKARLLFQPGVMVTSVPWQLDSARPHSHETALQSGADAAAPREQQPVGAR